MKFFSSIINTVKPAFMRFPFVYSLTVCGAASAMFYDFESWGQLCFCFFYCALLAFCLQLLYERFFKEKSKIWYISQIASIFLVMPLFLLYKNVESSHLAIHSLFLAFLALCPFLLSFKQEKNEIVLNIFQSGFTASIITLIFLCALEIIYWAVNVLLFDSELTEGDELIVIFSYAGIFINTFIAYSSKNHEEIKISKLCKTLFLYILLPLFVIYIFVLYCYLAKSIVTFSIPMREANTFISIASALYLLFYLTLPYFECRQTVLFKKIGRFILIPLIVLQIVISADRIYAHGISPNRYAVLMYTVFSIAVILLSFVSHGSKMLYASPVLAFLIVFSGLSPLNIQKVPLMSQTKIMEKVLNSHNLLIDGQVDVESAKNLLTAEDREILLRAYGKIAGLNKKPDWFSDDFKDLLKEDALTADYYFKLNVPSSYSFKLPSFSEFYLLDTVRRKHDEYSGILTYGNYSFDITSEIKKRLVTSDDEITEPWVLKNYGFTIIITNLDAHIYDVPLGQDPQFTEEELRITEISGFAIR